MGTESLVGEMGREGSVGKKKKIGQLGSGRKPVKIKAIHGPEEFFFPVTLKTVGCCKGRA